MRAGNRRKAAVTAAVCLLLPAAVSVWAVRASADAAQGGAFEPVAYEYPIQSAPPEQSEPPESEPPEQSELPESEPPEQSELPESEPPEQSELPESEPPEQSEPPELTLPPDVTLNWDIVGGWISDHWNDAPRDEEPRTHQPMFVREQDDTGCVSALLSGLPSGAAAALLAGMCGLLLRRRREYDHAGKENHDSS